MADRRRRRRSGSQSDSECSEDESKDSVETPKRAIRGSECESELGTKSTRTFDDSQSNVSEYESFDGDEETETETESETETEYDDSVIVEGEEWIEEERQSGDGEEQPAEGGEQNLDDDEDRKNPAYIPRRGAFYEHDTRIGEEDGQEEQEQRPKKKLWKDDDRWEHDRFRDDQQAPKSREELIAIYGYDIRLGDRPPDAPRGRGRGGGQRGRPRLGDFIQDRGDSQNRDDHPNRNNYQRRNDYQNRNDYQQRNDYPNRKEGYNQERNQEYGNRNDYGNDNHRGSYRGQSRGGRGRIRTRGGPPRRAYDNLRDNSGGDNYVKPAPTATSTTAGKQWPGSRQQPAVDSREDYPPLIADKAPPVSRQQVVESRRIETDVKEVKSRMQPDPPEAVLHTKGSEENEKEAKSVYNNSIKQSASPEDGEEDGEGPIIKIVGHAGLNTYERKSYQRDRRSKYNKPRQEGPGGEQVMQLEAGMRNISMKEGGPGQKTPAGSSQPRLGGPHTFSAPTQAVRMNRPPLHPSNGSATRMPGVERPRPFHPPPQQQQQPQQPAAKPETGAQARSKRYSSQRQRNMPDAQFQEMPPEKGMSPPVVTTPPAVGGPTGVNVGPPLPAGPRGQAPRTQAPVLRGQAPVLRGQAPLLRGQVLPPQSQGGATRGQAPPFYPPQQSGAIFSGGQQARPAMFTPDQPPPPPRAMATFPQAPILQPVQPVYTIPAGSQIQSPPRLFTAPPSTMPPVSIPPPTVAQPNALIQAPFIAAAPPPAILPNYAAPPPQASAGPPTHFQMAGHVPIQAFPPPPAPVAQPPVQVHVTSSATYYNAPEIPVVEPPAQQESTDAVHVKGGTTYFNTYMQQPSMMRSPTRRTKAAIPIVNPQDIQHDYEYEDEDDQMFVDAYSNQAEMGAYDEAAATEAGQQQQHWADEKDGEQHEYTGSKLNTNAPPYISATAPTSTAKAPESDTQMDPGNNSRDAVTDPSSGEADSKSDLSRQASTSSNKDEMNNSDNLPTSQEVASAPAANQEAAQESSNPSETAGSKEGLEQKTAEEQSDVNTSTSSPSEAGTIEEKVPSS